jgi:hypothetical protein
LLKEEQALQLLALLHRWILAGSGASRIHQDSKKAPWKAEFTEVRYTKQRRVGRVGAVDQLGEGNYDR